MAEVKTYYRPGLLFKADRLAQGHVECCRPEVAPRFTPDGTRTVAEAIPALYAEFGVAGGQFTYEDPLTGATEIGSEFWGGWFNLDEAAEQNNWDDDDKEAVARHMLTLPAGRAQFTLFSKAPAAKPIPNYDNLHHKQIPSIAQATGLVGEFLAYEKENKNRPEIIAKLEELVGAPASPPDEPVELAAA